jgi:hypothetical protein
MYWTWHLDGYAESPRCTAHEVACVAGWVLRASSVEALITTE